MSCFWPQIVLSCWRVCWIKLRQTDMLGVPTWQGPLNCRAYAFNGFNPSRTTSLGLQHDTEGSLQRQIQVSCWCVWKCQVGTQKSRVFKATRRQTKERPMCALILVDSVSACPETSYSWLLNKKNFEEKKNLNNKKMLNVTFTPRKDL